MTYYQLLRTMAHLKLKIWWLRIRYIKAWTHMILSCYGKDDKRIWIITDPGHEITTLLLPENY